MATGGDAIERMVLGGARATNVIVEDLLGESQRLAPLDEGTMAGSGHVVYYVNRMEYQEFSVALSAAIALARSGNLESFVGEVRYSTVYAAAQHEGIAFQIRGGEPFIWQARNYSKPGRRSKYIQAPLLEKAPRYEGALARSIRPHFPGGGFDVSGPRPAGPRLR